MTFGDPRDYHEHQAVKLRPGVAYFPSRASLERAELLRRLQASLAAVEEAQRAVNEAVEAIRQWVPSS